MHFIVETSHQLSNLFPEETCYIEVIPFNNKFHPILTSLSLVYYKNSTKGYILALDHSETFSLPFEEVKTFLNKHKKVYCFDQKITSYFFQHPNLVDIQNISLDVDNVLPEYNHNTKVHNDFYHNKPYVKDLNKIIPVVKHYERSESLYEQIKHYIGQEVSHEFFTKLCKEYKTVEQNGMMIVDDKFQKYYEPSWRPYSIDYHKIYTCYNLHNLTARPTNAFNNINFLALHKDDGSRRAFVPSNDLFLEFDFEAYHLALIARIIGYTFDNTESIHLQLGHQYFGKQEITPEDYAESKSITFQQIYGGIHKQYKHIPFFQEVDRFIQNLWQDYQKNSYIVLQTGRPLHLPKISMNPQKLFNYYVQNVETLQNVSILQKLNKLLETAKSKIVLVVYDSFLLDFSLKDGKNLLTKIKELIETDGFKVKVKVGKDYHSLTKTNYL